MELLGLHVLEYCCVGFIMFFLVSLEKRLIGQNDEVEAVSDTDSEKSKYYNSVEDNE